MASRAARKRKTKVDTRIAPTNEAHQHGAFDSAGMAYKRVPVIDTMLRREQITHAEYAALGHYRDQAHVAEKSPLRSCLDNSPRGSERGPSVATMSAMLETARIERDLGSLLDIARAIVVDDMSLAQWCIRKHGGRERYDGKGDFIALVPVRETAVMREATLEIKMAARRIVR